jgi:hypothetical protein
MDSRQIRIVSGVAAAVVLCWLTAPFWGAITPMDVPVSRAPLHFNADNAYGITSGFVTRHPQRVLGTLEARQASGNVRNHLRGLGYQISPPSYFEAIIAGSRQPGTNIIAYRPGGIPDVLAVIAHYDTARTTVQGAMDDGSGIGVMLELARAFTAAPLRHGLLIIASDGEEWGMLGAADFVESYSGRHRITAVLSLDWVSIGRLAELRLDTDGQRSGFSPAWLRRIAVAAAAEQGLPVRSPSGFKEFCQRAIDLSRTDQGPFLHAGIPAINMSSGSVDEARVRAVYHSPDDMIGNLLPASFGQYGQAAERILRSLDGVSAVPSMDDAFRWRNDTFVAAWAMKALHWLAFLPFAVMLAFVWANARPTLTGSAVLRETVFFVVWLIPFLVFFALVLFCRLMRFLPRSSLYPGPLHDPILENPAWLTVAIIAFLAAIIGVSLHFGARHLLGRQPRSFSAAKAVMLILFPGVIVPALVYDSYWAAAFLTLPALIWAALGRGRSPAARIAGAIAVLLAGLALYAQAIVSERSLAAGIDVLWYAVLGLGNGMLSWKGYFLSAGAIALGLRFLALQLSDSGK